MNFDDLIKGFDVEDRLLRAKEAAQFLKMAEQTLSVWRMKKARGHPCPDLPYRKIGRSVRYRLGDLKAFVNAHQQGSGAGKVQP